MVVPYTADSKVNSISRHQGQKYKTPNGGGRRGDKGKGEALREQADELRVEGGIYHRNSIRLEKQRGSTA